jgi:Protein of unknown function (DUF2637)
MRCHLASHWFPGLETEEVRPDEPDQHSAHTIERRRRGGSQAGSGSGRSALTWERVIRAVAGAAVLSVAGVAAIVSYSHIYELGRTHGQTGAAARPLPLSVDGLIVAASLVLLIEARAGQSGPPLARVMLGLGVAATIAANIAYGAAYGLTGAAVSAWPAVAFIGSAELLVASIRRARPVPATIPAEVAVPAVSRYTTGAVSQRVLVPEVVRVQAGKAFADELSAGEVPSIRLIRSRMHVGQARAQQIRGYLAAVDER